MMKHALAFGRGDTEGETNGNAGALARRSILVAALLALAGSIVSMYQIRQGQIAGLEVWLVSSGVIAEAAILLLSFCFHRVRSEALAIFATLFFGAYLCVGCLLTITPGQQHAHLEIYLIWFFPLLIFNRIVNAPAMAKSLGRALLVLPPFLLICFWPNLQKTFNDVQQFTLIHYGLSYLTLGVILNFVTRYRAAYDAERARASILKAEAEITEHLAFYDLLTDLPNRLLLKKVLGEALSQPETKDIGALLLIDLDHFQTLNDTLGHTVGDLLLREVAERLRRCVTAGQTLARLGGDEFVLLLQGLGSDHNAAELAAKAFCNCLAQEFAQPFRAGEYECTTTTSIGVALFGTAHDTPDDLFRRADLALYEAKSQGRNCACVFRHEMQIAVDGRAAMESDLRRALQNEEFYLVYQPQIDHQGHVFGAEALLRWQHPERGLVPPLEFIPLAEETGLILAIGRWVLETACAQLAQWARSPETAGITLSVNVSMRQLLHAHFVETLREILRETGAIPTLLKLEMTESAVMEMVDESIAKMTELSDTGVHFSLDDFGTGYSSLLHLKRLPLGQIKIDRSFVRDVLTDITDASITRTIIALADNLNLSVVAEGVETEGQLAFLAREGCHCFQGYLFSKPLPAAQFQQFAAERAQQNGVSTFPEPLVKYPLPADVYRPPLYETTRFPAPEVASMR